MVTDLKRTILYICPVCGKIQRFNIDVFSLNSRKKLILSCRCKNSHIRLSIGKNKMYSIYAPCMVCNEEHIFEIGAKVFWNAPQIVFGCPNVEFDIINAGDKDTMNEIYCDFNKNKSDYYICSGEYFSENPILSDVLDEVDNFIKKKKIKCTCGEKSVQKNVYLDRVELVCKSCGARRIFDAASINDIKFVKSENKKSEIILS